MERWKRWTDRNIMNMNRHENMKRCKTGGQIGQMGRWNRWTDRTGGQIEQVDR